MQHSSPVSAGQKIKIVCSPNPLLFKLRFVNEETTDIEEIEFTENGQQTMTIYNLTGRRVDAPVKGSAYTL